MSRQRIDDMSAKHKKNCINLVEKTYLPRCRDEDMEKLLKKKIEEL